MDGTNAGTPGKIGIRLTTSSSTIKGLVINRFSFAGIQIFGSSNLVQGNYIGTDVAGTAGLGNGLVGIYVLGSTNTIGGTTAAARNVISGNGPASFNAGISLQDCVGTIIQGNYIGTNAAGTAAIANNGDGITVTGSSSNTTIGGSAAGAGNLISGNAGNGVSAFNSGGGTSVKGNKIGTQADGNSALGNTFAGVKFFTSNNSAGGAGANEGNIVAFNSQGVLVNNNSTQNSIRRNSIFSNTNLGIDLGAFTLGDGVTANDAGDGDPGPNNKQNFPVITSAITGGPNTITGTLNTTASTSGYVIEFFASSACNAVAPNNYGEGQTYLGSVTTGSTDGSGDVGFTFNPGTLNPGDVITATATDTNGNTSEFSECFTATAPGNAISGTVYNDKGTTNIGTGKAVKLFVNGGAPTTTTTNGSGQYSFSSVSFSAGDVITVFISGATERGATVTLAPNPVADITGLDIYRDSLIGRHDTAGPITNANLNTGNPGSDGDLNAIYAVAGGTTLNVAAGKELRIPSGESYTPGGDVTTTDLFNAGTLSAGASTINIAGVFINTGTFNKDTSTFFYNGTAQTILALNYYNLTFSDNAKTLASAGTIGIAGTFTPGNNSLHTTNDSTIEFNGTSSQGVPVFHTYYNLTVNNTAGTTGAFGLKVNNTLTVQAGTFSSASDYHHVVISSGGTLSLAGDVTVSGNWTNNGTFTHNGYNVTFDGDAANQTIGGNNSTTFAALLVGNTGPVNNNIVSLDGSLGAINVSATSLSIANGVFAQGTGSSSANFSTTGSGTVVNITAGKLQNFGTGDLTLSGNVSNAGTIEFNGNGTGCHEIATDDISISSTGSARTWSGTGTFSMTDVTVSNQSSAAPPVTILVNSGTNAGGNTGWTFVDQCTAGTYTWIGGTLGANTDWQVGTNWNPTRATAAPGDVLIFDGTSTPAPTVTNVPTQTISSLQLKNNANPVTLNAAVVGAPHTLTITGDAGLSVASGSRLELAGSNGLTIAVTTGSGSTINGQIALKGGPHRLTGANAGQITFPSGAIFTAGTTPPASGFTGNPFGTGTTDSVRFQDGSNAFFNEGSDPFGTSGGVVTFTSASNQQFNTSTAWSAGGPSYGNLTLAGASQTYFDSGASSQVTVMGNLTIANGSTLKLSDFSGGDLNLWGNFTDDNSSFTAFQHNGRVVKFQGGSATQTISKNVIVGGQIFGHLTINKTGGSVQLLSEIAINGQLLFDGAGSAVDVLELNGKGVSLGGTISAVPNANSGFKGDTIGGSLFVGVNASPLGNPIHFVSGGEFLNLFFVDRASGAAVDTDLTIGHPTAAPNGNLTLTNGILDMGSKTLTLNPNATISRTNGYVIGNLKKNFGATGAFTFTVGTANGYSPVATNVTAGSFPADFTVKANQGAMPGISGANKLARYWTLTNTTITNANLTFNYLASDVTGTVANYQFVKKTGVVLSILAPTGTPTSTQASINGVTSFSDWTLAEANALYVVNTTTDTDDTTCDAAHCSLREAINGANANADASTINFNIPLGDSGYSAGTGVFTIAVTLTPLPEITQRVTIDGATQTTFSGNTNADGPEVVINGSALGGSPTGLYASSGAASSVIANLVINGFTNGTGIVVWANNAQVLNNYIGTNASGTAAVPNAGGLGVGASAGNTSGYTITGNLISGNTAVGISSCDITSGTFSNNKIGTDRTGVSNLGNGGPGLVTACGSWRDVTISNNIFAFNGSDGFRDVPDYGGGSFNNHPNIRLTQNSFFNNGGIGINLRQPPNGSTDGVTPNDAGDADEGGNHLQNFPVITVANSSTETINGTLNTAPSTTSYVIEFFKSSVCDGNTSGASSGTNGEGQTYLGSVTTGMTDGNGDVAFTFNSPVAFAAGDIITATATDASGNTSEFSLCFTAAAGETDVALSSGNLLITDGNLGTSNDTLTISLVSGPTRIRVHDPANTLNCGAGTTQFGPNTCDIPQGSVTGNIQVNTLDGNDSLTLNFASGNFVPSGGLIYNGGAQSGSPGDTLTVTGGSNSTITHTFNNANDGSIQIDTINIQYTGLEPVTDNMAAVNRVFTFTGGAETITVADAAGANMTIDSTLGESVTFANPTNNLTINAGTGDDTITISSVDTDGPFVDLLIYGDNDNDTVNLNADITFATGRSLVVTAETVNVAASADLTISGGGGEIDIRADNIAIDSTATLSAGHVFFRPQTANRPISLGSETGGQLSLTDAELDRVTAGSQLAIGANNSGTITISGGIDLTDGPVIATLTLVTGANVTETFAGNDLTVDALNITAPTGIGGIGGQALDLAVTTLKTDSSGSNGPQFLNELDTVNVGPHDLNAGTGTITLYNAPGGRFNTTGVGGDILSDVVVASGATLGGGGSVLSTKTTTVESGGTLSPGTSPGTLNTGQVTFNSGSSFNVEINGTTVTTGYDQLNVTGSVTLGSATVNLSGTHTPVVGDTFVIVNNDSIDLVTGNFTMGTGGTDSNGGTLAEGDTITNFLGSLTINATITYAGGSDSNDVVLTAVAANADLTVTKSAPASVTEGNNFSYTITVSNSSSAGTATATGVTLADTLPGGVIFVSASAGCTGGATVNCTLPDIAPGGSQVVTIVVTAGAAPATALNTATASATNEPDAPVSSNQTSTTITAAECEDPPASLLAWYPGDGNANDIQGPPFENGTVQGGATFATGKVNQAFSFAGGSNDGVLTSLTLNYSNGATLDAWIKTSDSEAGAIVTDGGGSSGSNGMGLFVESGLVKLYGSNGAGLNFVVNGTNVTDGNWHHIAGTWTGTTAPNDVKLYVDGVEAATGTAVATVGNGLVPFSIGGDPASPSVDFNNFNGLIDEVEIFNTAVSAGDILAIYNASFAGKCRECTTPPTNMVSWWDGSGSAPTANDIAGSNDGALQDGAIFAPGKVGQGFSFNGTSAYVSAGNDAVFNFTNAMTVDAWVKSDGLTMSYAPIVAKGDGAWRLQTYGNLNVASFGTTGLSDVDLVGTTNIIDGQWHHVAGVFDGSTKYLYVDGVLDASVAVSGSISVTGDEVRIGGVVATPPRFWNGLIDEVQLFNRALSASEIAAIANAGNAGKCHTSAVTVGVDPASVTEDGAGNLVYTFSRSGDITTAVTVNFSIGGTASFSANDYSQAGATTYDSPTAQGTLAFLANEGTKTVTIDPTPDAPVEPDETVVLTVTAGTGYVVGNPDTATGTITNDDATLTLVKAVVNNNGGTKVVADFPLFIDGSPVTSGTPTAVSANAVHTATETTQTGYTASVWGGDCAADGTITLQPGDNKTCTITNDDVVPTISIDNVSHAEADTGTVDYDFTVSLSYSSTQTITVDYATANDSAVAPGDYTAVTTTQLTFNPGETSKPVKVVAITDTVYELNEDFVVNLSSPVNATIGDGEGRGTITNDDPQPNLSIGNVIKFEGTTPGTVSFDFTVTKSGNATDVNATVNYASAPGTASENPTAACGGTFDYQFKSGSLTFTPLEFTKTITILVCKDSTFEADETFFVNLTGETNVTVTDNQGLGTIANDDAAPPLSPVNTTDDTNDGTCNATHCSLREAINAANASAGSVSIIFAIPVGDSRHFYYTDDGVAGQVSLANITTTTAADDSGLVNPDPDWPHSWWSILPASALPALNTTAVGATIDGYSQSGASADTASAGHNAILRIEINGSAIPGGVTYGLEIDNGSNTVTGLIINRFLGTGGPGTGNGVGMTDSSDALRGNFIGTDPSGTIDVGNAGSGVVVAVSNVNIGGANVGDANLISGNDGHGIAITGNSVVVQGNYIGTKANGTSALPNTLNGVAFNGGGAVFNTLGGTGAGEANLIGFNGQDGVNVGGGFSNLIRANSIFSNGTTSAHLGIDLGTDGVALNDDLDPDSGANKLQNFPIIRTALAGTPNRIRGTLNSEPNQTYTIDLYSNTACDTSGNGEGKKYLGSTTADTGANGDALWSFNPAPGDLNSGDFVTATATDSLGNTSEFSACFQATGFNAGTVQFVNAPYTDSETNADHSVTITVSRTGGSNLAMDVTYQTSDGTAMLADNDYVAASGTLHWNNGETGDKTFTITVKGDTIFEGAETVNITLSGATISGTIPTTLTITNDDPQPALSINDVALAEGNSGTTNFIFTVTKTNHGAVSVNYQTQNDTATTGNSDYQSTSGTLSWGALDTTPQTITVLVNGDTAPELNETFSVLLSGEVGATLTDGTGLGTILNDDESVSAGQLIISEFRLSGPGANATEQANNEFIELYNSTDADIFVTTTDGSTGWAVATSSGAPIFFVPNGTTIPARGHYLGTNTTGYSLKDYGGTDASLGDATWTTDVADNSALAVFRTNNPVNFSVPGNRLDSVGPNTETNTLYREGTGYSPLAPANLAQNLEHTFFRQICVFQAGCPTPGRARDTQDNAADFIFADTIGAATSAGQRLGSPGPENLASPIKRDPAVNLVFLDASVADGSAPNRVRDSSPDGANASSFGTMTIRRRVVNQTGGNVTRLRFRVIDMTTLPSGVFADLRLRTSSDTLAPPDGSGGVIVSDSGTCGAKAPPESQQCTVTVRGLTLEQPPNVAASNGGGLNTTVTLDLSALPGGGLAPNQSVNVQFLLGVQKTGQFRFYLVIEALP